MCDDGVVVLHMMVWWCVLMLHLVVSGVACGNVVFWCCGVVVVCGGIVCRNPVEMVLRGRVCCFFVHPAGCGSVVVW